MADWKYLGGGLLSGVGQGMVAEAKGKAARAAARQQLLDDMALQDVRHEHRTQEIEHRANLAATAAETKREHDLELEEIRARGRAGEIIKYIETGGETVGLTRGGKAVKTGLKGMAALDDDATANMREAKWLVAEGIAPDTAAAYEMVRSRSGMDEQAIRAAALKWASNVENALGRQKYTTPDEIAGAMQAYMQFIKGDLSGAKTTLAGMDPDAKKPENEKSWWSSMWDSVKTEGAAGAGATVAMPQQPGAPAQQPQAQPVSAQTAPQMQPPPGTGSQAAPYLAATQAHIDWFKANGQAGEFIQLPDGRVLTK